MLRVKEITQKYERTKITLREFWYKATKSGKICGQYSKTWQIAKISRPAKSSQHCKIFCNAHPPSVFRSNCHLLCSYSFELGSGSSHLNWLEDSGTIGLQNYKKYPQNMISSIVGTLVYQLGYLS